jgi:hypothetical protein
LNKSRAVAIRRVHTISSSEGWLITSALPN